MSEKREFPRYSCKIPVKFAFFEGNPDEINIQTDKSIDGKGIIVDISRGGIFIISTCKISINMPINLKFSSKTKKINIAGIIVRTGLIKNNPSEVALRYAKQKVKGDTYIAVKFNIPLDDIIV